MFKFHDGCCTCIKGFLKPNRLNLQTGGIRVKYITEVLLNNASELEPMSNIVGTESIQTFKQKSTPLMNYVERVQKNRYFLTVIK